MKLINTLRLKAILILVLPMLFIDIPLSAFDKTEERGKIFREKELEEFKYFNTDLSILELYYRHKEREDRRTWDLAKDREASYTDVYNLKSIIKTVEEKELTEKLIDAIFDDLSVRRANAYLNSYKALLYSPIEILESERNRTSDKRSKNIIDVILRKKELLGDFDSTGKIRKPSPIKSSTPKSRNYPTGFQ